MASLEQLKKMFVPKTTNLQSVFTSNASDVNYLNHIFTLNTREKFTTNKTIVHVYRVMNFSYGIYDECKLSIFLNSDNNTRSVILSNTSKTFDIYYSYNSSSGDLKIFIKHKVKDMSVKFLLEYGDSSYLTDFTLGNKFNISISSEHIKANVNGNIPYITEANEYPTLVNNWTSIVNESFYVRRLNDWVNLHMAITGGVISNTTESETVAILPEEFRPKSGFVYFRASYLDSKTTNEVITMGRIYADGTVKVPKKTDNTRLLIDTTYKI